MPTEIPDVVLTDLVQLLRSIVNGAETECVCDTENDRCAGCLARRAGRYFDVITDDEYREWMKTRRDGFASSTSPKFMPNQLKLPGFDE